MANRKKKRRRGQAYFTRTSKAKTLLQQPPNIRDKIIGKSEATNWAKAPVNVGLSIYCIKKGLKKKMKKLKN